jgi:hypothetical protein
MRVRAAVPLVSLFFCQCASGPGPVSPLARADARIEAVYENGSTVLHLRGANGESAEHAYSSGTAPNLKIARAEDMQRLVAALDECGFFANASAARDPGSTAALTVTIDGHSRVMSRLPTTASTVERNQRFNNCVQAYRYVYDNTVSFHSGSSVRIEDLREQNERVQREAKEALERLQGRR